MVYLSCKDCFLRWIRRRRWRGRREAAVSRLELGWRRLWDLCISLRVQEKWENVEWIGLQRDMLAYESRF